MMSFRITGLPRAPFADLFTLDDEGLRRRGAMRVTADAKPGFPCRVSLEDAEPGEALILVHHEHQSADTPFRASHAIYVREQADEAFDAVDVVPEQFRSRTLSLRAFDAGGMMIDADLVEGSALEPALEPLLANPAVAYMHAHFAKPGCYAARIERA